MSKVRSGVPMDSASSDVGDGEETLDDVEAGVVKEEDANDRFEQITKKNERHTSHLKSNERINHAKSYNFSIYRKKRKATGNHP